MDTQFAEQLRLRLRIVALGDLRAGDGAVLRLCGKCCDQRRSGEENKSNTHGTLQQSLHHGDSSVTS
jgi:hypothetical protein